MTGPGEAGTLGRLIVVRFLTFLFGGRRPSPALAALVLVAAATLALEAGPSAEIRGLWVVRTSLRSPEAIQTLVRDAKASGVNTLIVQVRGRGDAYYASDLEPRASTLHGQPPSFDPLAETLRVAHAAGLAVHAWINVNLVSSATDLPGSRAHVVNRHPEWLMVPRALGTEFARLDPHHPAYVGKLARWTRAQANVEGLFTSPLHPEAAAHTTAVVTDVVTRYAVDGVHLDYVRFPSADFDYGAAALAAFRESVLPDLASPDRARLDGRLNIDPFVYADTYPVRWANFRRSRLTALVMRVRSALRQARPDLPLSAAVFPGVDEAGTTRLQDWRLWVENGLVDVVCPMLYTPDAALFAEQLREATRVAGPTAVWAGIGAYRLSPAQTVANITTARTLGTRGVLLFSYDSMAEASERGADYLGYVGRAAFADPAPSAEGARQP